MYHSRPMLLMGKPTLHYELWDRGWQTLTETENKRKWRWMNSLQKNKQKKASDLFILTEFYWDLIDKDKRCKLQECYRKNCRGPDKSAGIIIFPRGKKEINQESQTLDLKFIGNYLSATSSTLNQFNFKEYLDRPISMDNNWSCPCLHIVHVAVISLVLDHDLTWKEQNYSQYSPLHLPFIFCFLITFIHFDFSTKCIPFLQIYKLKWNISNFYTRHSHLVAFIHVCKCR